MKPYAVVAKQERVVAVIVSISKVFASSCRNFAKVLNEAAPPVCCKAFARVIGLAKPSFQTKASLLQVREAMPLPQAQKCKIK